VERLVPVIALFALVPIILSHLSFRSWGLVVSMFFVKWIFGAILPRSFAHDMFDEPLTDLPCFSLLFLSDSHCASVV
jgi:hypothetical protein